VHSAAYLGLLNPTNLCENFLAHLGTSTETGGSNYAFNVTANAVFTVVVWERFVNSGGDFALTVSGGSCRPLLNILPAAANKIVLDWSTAAIGYRLESTNTLGLPPWAGVATPPVIQNSRFRSTNDATETSQFFHLRNP
jgi:hypothetical protein